MFGFANALLLLLLAAACLDFVPVLRRRLSPTAWWAEERPLFCACGAAVRQRYGTAVFLLGVMVYEFIVVFNNSMARENWPWLQTRVSPVLDWVMYLCFGCKILLGTRYSGRSLLCAGALYFVARWVYFNGQNIWWLGLCVALLAAKDVPLRRVMKAFLACGMPTLALVELLHFAGIIAPDAASERNGSYRLMFGYGHPNTFGGVMFGLLLALLLAALVSLMQIGLSPHLSPLLDGNARDISHHVALLLSLAALATLAAQFLVVRPQHFSPVTLLCIAAVLMVAGLGLMSVAGLALFYVGIVITSLGAAMATPGYQLLLNDRLTTGKGAGAIATSHTLGYGISALLVPVVTRFFGEQYLTMAAGGMAVLFFVLSIGVRLTGRTPVEKN